LPTALGVAVLIAAGIMIAVFALKPSSPPPSFLPGETGSPTATATQLQAAAQG